MIRNTTSGKVLCKNSIDIHSVLGKIKGLMFSKPLKDTGMIFYFSKERRVDLHMFFVFFPIDVLFLDKDKKVVAMKEKFNPFSIHVPKKKAQYVLELPHKTIQNSKTELGHKISF